MRRSKTKSATAFCKAHEKNPKYKAQCGPILSKLKPGPIPNVDADGSAQLRMGVEAAPSACRVKYCRVRGPDVWPKAKDGSFAFTSDSSCEKLLSSKFPHYLADPYSIESGEDNLAGYKVSKVDPSGLAAKVGVQVGDVLLSLSQYREGTVSFDHIAHAASLLLAPGSPPDQPKSSSEHPATTTTPLSNPSFDPLQKADDHLKYVHPGQKITLEVCRITPVADGFIDAAYLKSLVYHQ